MAEGVAMGIAPMIIEPLMKRMIRHVRYAFNFNKIVQELTKETAELKNTQDRVQHDVDRAKDNAEKIEKIVETWQMDVEKIIAEVVRLEEDTSQNKSCINGLCPNLFWRYSLAKKAVKKKDAMTQLREKGGFSRVSYFPSDNLPGIEARETKDVMPSASASSAFNKIMKELKDDKKKIIALYGMGGVGKTTLAVKVGKKAKELKLFAKVIMVVVSQNLSIEGIQSQIAKQIGLEDSSHLQLRLEKMEGKILIVLDDLWQKLDLKSIGIPSIYDCTNIKVLLTTRQQHVCNTMRSQCKIPLDVLTDEEAWALFKKCGGLSNDPSPLTVVAKSIADECKGLPLAIVTVASALKGKSSRDDWDVALQKLRGSRYVDIDDADQDVYKCIRFSYDYLKDEEARLCFLLCSLFPEDHDIEVEVLVRYVYGLGLFQYVVHSIDSVRKELHVAIKSLKASSLLLTGNESFFGRPKSNKFVKMHDIVRDVALWISSGDKLNISTAGMGLEEWPRSKHCQSMSRISLMNNKIAEHCSGLVCPRLNLLLLDENGCYEFPDDFFDGMRELQVLSVCEYTQGPILRHSTKRPSFSLPQSIQHLTNLCTLRIEWLKLNDISVLGKLKGLEILSLRGSHLEELPSSIGELNGLRLFDLSYCAGSMRIADKLFRKLSKLEELYIDIPGRDEGNCYAFLCDLMSLSKLSILSLKIDNIQCLREGICFPKHLKRYYIRIGDSNRYNLRELSYPASKELNLQKMDVGKLNAFKEIIPGVNNLWLRNIKDDCIMPADFELGRTGVKVLSHLEMLKLSDLPELTRIWKGPTIEVVSLVKLRELEVDRCPKLTSLLSLSLAQCLVQLRVLKISWCNELKQIFYAEERQEIGQEPTEWFPQLRELSLSKLPKFISFWHENYIPTLPVMPCLEKLCVEGCPNMGTQFIAALRVFEKKLEEVEGPNWSGSCNIVLEKLKNGSRKSLQKLSITNVEVLQLFIPGLIKVERELTIRGCKGVEKILEVGGQQSTVNWKQLTLAELPDLTCIWRGPSQLLIFHNLEWLSVIGCHGLKKHLLTTSIARSLLHLSFLEVKDCKELEQIFADDETDNTYSAEIVTLPRLLMLRLNQLPNLINFCPSTYHFIFPCNSIYVANCTNNRTGFSQENGTEGGMTTVHAKGEALSSTQSRGKCNDIIGSHSLPLYGEETVVETSDECLQRGTNNT